MKEYVIRFSEIVYYDTVIEAESIDEVYEIFMNGEWNDINEYDRSYNELIDIKEVDNGEV